MKNFDKLITRLLRRQLNAFAKRIISRAQERMIINNDTWHELADMIDRELFPERFSKK